jgi:hypothetical protein
VVKIVEQRDHYVLLADGGLFAVVERRAGRFYPLSCGAREGYAPDDPALARKLGASAWSDEATARAVLQDLEERRRQLAERIW